MLKKMSTQIAYTQSSKKNNEPRGGGTDMNLRIMLKKNKEEEEG